MKLLYEQLLYYDVKRLYMHAKYIIFVVSTWMVFILEKNCTKRPFLVYCGLLSAIKQPRMVQLIRSNIQNYRFYVETFSQALDFWFQHLKGVHFGKNDTRISFLVVINECITMKKVRGIHLRWLEDNSKRNSGHTFSRKWFSSLMRTKGPLCSLWSVTTVIMEFQW